MAKEMAASGEWLLCERTSPFGGSLSYLRAIVTYPIRSGNVQVQPPTSTPTTEICWDDDDDDVATPTCPPGEPAAEVSYFVCFSDAFQVPQLYFTGSIKRGASTTSLSSSDEWNTLVFGGLCETDLVVPAARPIIGSSYCEELGLAAMSLHQCDTAALIEECGSRNVKDRNMLRSWLRLLAPTLGLPPRLLQ